VPIPVIPSREQVRIGDLELVNQLMNYTSPRLAQYFDRFDRVCKPEERFLWLILVIVQFFVLIYLSRLIKQQKMKKWMILVFIFLPSILILITHGIVLSSDTFPDPFIFQTFFLNVGIVITIVLILGGATPTLIEVLVVLVIIFILSWIAYPSFLPQASMKLINRTSTSVTVADQFTIGEYDVTLLSAKESDGLVNWLRENDYKIPDQATSMLETYIQSGMKFFVVRVNLEAFKKSDVGYLRPIVLDYQSDKFMLPIRLGTLNADQDQDLTIVVLSPTSYVETENYPTLTIPTDAKSRADRPSGLELPYYIRGEFQQFYQAVFQKAYEQSDRSSVFLEFAGATQGGTIGDPIGGYSFGGNKCDPCVMELYDVEDFLSQLTEVGAFWEKSYSDSENTHTYVTRLHVRYNAKTFPEDLYFKEISPEALIQRVEAEDKLFPNLAGVAFQGRYVFRLSKGKPWCLAARPFWNKKYPRVEHLANLTGWNPQEIQRKIKANHVNQWGETALHHARTLAEVDRLLKQGALPNLPDAFGDTPFHNAISHAHWNKSPEALAIVEHLLESGADPNQKDGNGYSPLDDKSHNPKLSELLDRYK